MRWWELEEEEGADVAACVAVRAKFVTAWLRVTKAQSCVPRPRRLRAEPEGAAVQPQETSRLPPSPAAPRSPSLLKVVIQCRLVISNFVRL